MFVFVDFIFEVVDKTGRKIRFSKKQYSHSMRKHSYMHKYMEEIKQTIQNPDKIIYPTKDKGYYYKRYKYLKNPNRFILVVVKYLNGDGYIITSYLEEKIK